MLCPMRHIKTHILHCCIPPETMNKLKFIAAGNGRSANKEIEQLILKHIATWEKDHGPILFDDNGVPQPRSK